VLQKGGVLAVPTDSSYALVCHLDDKAAADRLRRIRGVDDKHHLTLLCRDLSELASYARVDNRQYRLLKLGTPAPTPSSWRPAKRCRAASATPRARPSACACPTTKPCKRCWPARRAAAGHHADPPTSTDPMNDAQDIRERFEHELAAVIDAGACALEPTTVVDLTPMGEGDEPAVLRQGRGPGLAALGL
jgi:tRNA A37 threonylcarbamoyladenosine synthetase subunit TsaC/SUA5/YrdC